MAGIYIVSNVGKKECELFSVNLVGCGKKD